MKITTNLLLPILIGIGAILVFFDILSLKIVVCILGLIYAIEKVVKS